MVALDCQLYMALNWKVQLQRDWMLSMPNEEFACEHCIIFGYEGCHDCKYGSSRMENLNAFSSQEKCIPFIPLTMQCLITMWMECPYSKYSRNWLKRPDRQQNAPITFSAIAFWQATTANTLHSFVQFTFWNATIQWQTSSKSCDNSCIFSVNGRGNFGQTADNLTNYHFIWRDYVGCRKQQPSWNGHSLFPCAYLHFERTHSRHLYL